METQIFETLLALCGAVLHGEIPDGGLLDGVDLSLLYRAAKRHSLEALACEALESLSLPDLPPEWIRARDRSLRRSILLSAALSGFGEFCAENGISYLPLKGSVLQSLYPRPELRQMIDNDVLIDPKDRERVRDYFVSQGYTVSAYDVSNHDEYEQDSFVRFEIHTTLISWENDVRWRDYYDGILSRLPDEEGQRGRKRFSDEDFYVFMLLHAAKHRRFNGVGLRTLTDIFVFLRAKPALDRALVAEKLRTLGIYEEAAAMEGLTRKTLGREETPLTEEEEALRAELFGSATYGTQEMKLDRAMERSGTKTKAGYLLTRLFPPAEYIRTSYPVSRRHPVLLPLCYLARLFKGASQTEKNRREMETIRKYGKTK